jgi:hypothetical protein
MSLPSAAPVVPWRARYGFDPVWSMIRKKRQRYEVRIWIADKASGPPPGAGGRGRGRQRIIGRYHSLWEAQRARDRALANGA